MIKLILSSLYIGTLLFSPIFNAKIVHFGWWVFLAWAPMIAFTSGIIDVINQNFGKESAKKTVLTALIVRAVLYLGIFPILMLFPDKTDGMGINKLLTQSFRNFAVSEGLTLIARYWIQVPMFAKMKTWFTIKYNITNWILVLIKALLQTFLMYVGVTEVQLIPLMVGETVTKSVFIFLGTPFASGLNWVVKKLKEKNIGQ